VDFQPERSSRGASLNLAGKLEVDGGEDLEEEKRSPLAKTTDFQFTFKQFWLELLSDSYDVDAEDGEGGAAFSSLARISVDNFSVRGDVTVNGAVRVKAGLENVVLEDTRWGPVFKKKNYLAFSQDGDMSDFLLMQIY
jgi:hypothetical protein